MCALPRADGRQPSILSVVATFVARRRWALRDPNDRLGDPLPEVEHAQGSGLGFGGLREDLADDLVGFDALGFALEVEEHAMAQRGKAHLPDVVDRRREPTFEKG